MRATYGFKNEGRRKLPLVLRNNPVPNDLPQYTPPELLDLLKKQVATYSFKDKPRPDPSTLVYKDQVKLYEQLGFFVGKLPRTLRKIFYIPRVLRVFPPTGEIKTLSDAWFSTEIKQGLPNLQICAAGFFPVRPPYPTERTGKCPLWGGGYFTQDSPDWGSPWDLTCDWAMFLVSSSSLYGVPSFKEKTLFAE